MKKAERKTAGDMLRERMQKPEEAGKRILTHTSYQKKAYRLVTDLTDAQAAEILRAGLEGGLLPAGKVRFTEDLLLDYHLFTQGTGGKLSGGAVYWLHRLALDVRNAEERRAKCSAS